MNFFPRGQGPLVSILIPTRDRIRDLAFSVDSCIGFAHDPSWLEFVIRIDDDDQKTIDFVDHLKTHFSKCSFKILVRPKLLGYTQLNLAWNELAEVSSGDWLFFWNDDALIKTKDWDLVLNNHVSPTASPGTREICVLMPYKSERAFPIVRRGLFDLLGHVTKHFLLDTYIVLLCTISQRTDPIKIDTMHLKSIMPVHTSETDLDFFSNLLVDQQFRINLLKDVKKIHAYLVKKENQAVYTDKPLLGARWYLCRFPNNVREAIFVSEDGIFEDVVGTKFNANEASGLKWCGDF